MDRLLQTLNTKADAAPQPPAPSPAVGPVGSLSNALASAAQDLQNNTKAQPTLTNSSYL